MEKLKKLVEGKGDKPECFIPCTCPLMKDFIHCKSIISIAKCFNCQYLPYREGVLYD